MTVTFVHIGDVHAAPGERNAERYDALDQIIDAGLQIPTLGAWLLPGDFNHARMSIEDRNALAARLQRMADAAPVVAAYGNHDLPGDLDIFRVLRTMYPIYISAVPEFLRVQLRGGGSATIFVLPYPTKAGLVAAGVAHSDVVGEASTALTAICAEAGAQLAQARAAGDITLMIGHVNVSGAMTSVGQPNIGQEIEIDATHLALLGDGYKGLNHIHVGQSIAGAWYPGSVTAQDWGEIEPKGYLRIDYAQDAGQWSHTVTVQPIDTPKLWHVEGDLTREGFAWQVMKGPGGAVMDKPDSWAGQQVRVRYRFRQSEKGVLSDAVILAEFADAAKLKLEPVALPDRALRAPEVASARSLHDKIAAWCAVSQVVAPDGLASKVARLERGDPTRVLSEVQAQIAQITAADAVQAVA